MTKLVKTTRKLATPRKSRQAAKAGQFIISMMNQEPEPAPEPVEPEVPEVAPEPVEPEVPEVAPEPVEPEIPEVAPEAKPAKAKVAKSKPAPKAKAKPAMPAKAKAAPVITKPTAAREASKKAMLIEMLRRGEGVSTEEIMNTFGWQAHTCRGLISTLKKGGLPITAEHTREVGLNKTGARGSTTIYYLPTA